MATIKTTGKWLLISAVAVWWIYGLATDQRHVPSAGDPCAPGHHWANTSPSIYEDLSCVAD